MEREAEYEELRKTAQTQLRDRPPPFNGPSFVESDSGWLWLARQCSAADRLLAPDAISSHRRNIMSPPVTLLGLFAAGLSLAPVAALMR